MKLTLSLRMSPPPDGVEAAHALDEGSMTIGRAPEATWTIPDPARVISKQHCRIDAAPEGFSITDISTNGAFLNEQPIGNQVTRRLADGDLVRMGDIVIVAHIEDADKAAADSALPADGPFGDNENFPKPKPEAAASSPMDAGPIAEDWWKEAPPGAEGVAGRLDAGSSLPLGDAIVVSLVESFPGLDVAMLAQGIDRAGAVVGDREWRAFYDRLQAFLRETYPENA